VGCDDVQRLLHSYIDGELDLVHSIELEKHLEGCASCKRAHSAFLALRASVKSPEHYHRAPAALEDRIRTALEQPAAREPSLPVARPARRVAWRVLALAASVAAAFLIVRVLTPAGGDPLAAEILAGHIRSLMPGHLTDVESGDGHTVKPWFAGKLDFSPPVPDLSAAGFPVLGGRLDYIGGRPVAALVYGRRQHRINVFVWPAARASDRSPNSWSRQGYNSVSWAKSGMEYRAISDLNAAELRQFVDLFSR
jgi:anti-sigma factor RsiW